MTPVSYMFFLGRLKRLTILVGTALSRAGYTLSCLFFLTRPPALSTKNITSLARFSLSSFSTSSLSLNLIPSSPTRILVGDWVARPSSSLDQTGSALSWLSVCCLLRPSQNIFAATAQLRLLLYYFWTTWCGIWVNSSWKWCAKVEWLMAYTQLVGL